MSTVLLDFLFLLCAVVWTLFLLAIAAIAIALPVEIGRTLMRTLKRTKMLRAWNAQFSRRKSDTRFLRDTGITH